MTYFTYALAGLFLVNGIPHLAAGLRGEPFPTPFAKPPGKGLSPPLVNFVWGSANLFVGLWFASRALGLPFDPAVLAAAATFLLGGAWLSRHFGQARAEGFR